MPWITIIILSVTILAAIVLIVLIAGALEEAAIDELFNGDE